MTEKLINGYSITEGMLLVQEFQASQCQERVQWERNINFLSMHLSTLLLLASVRQNFMQGVPGSDRPLLCHVLEQQ